MPNTAKTDIEVAQRAMVLVGMEPLSSFTEGTDEALVMNTTYEDVVEDCLAQHNWNFATGQIQLSRLADTPIDRWDSAYALPTNPSVIQVQTITISNVVQTYDIYEKYIYINASENDDVVLNYIYRVDTQYWTPAFTLWVIYRLASILALSVTRKADIAKSYRELAEMQFRRAKARDSQQVTTTGIALSRYHRIRLGSGLYAKIEGTSES
mgnify:FL=1|jgi:hypothetical protein|tara:strand:- start:1735 stop:2364 length:630 start_codon:yes stop_codon:yes gene_type:complete